MSGEATDRRERTAAYVNEHGVWIDGSFLIEKYLYATDRQTTGVQWLVYTVKDGNLTYLEAFRTRRAAAEFIGGRRG